MPSIANPIPDPRDRFLAFAFAGAELLVETLPDGRITFATGAFPPHFGQASGAFVGRHVATLIAPDHQAAFALALHATTARGRIAPMLVRLDDIGRSVMCLSALLLPGPSPHLFFSIGPAPTHIPDSQQESSGTPILPPGAGAIARAATLQMQCGGASEGGSIGLLELAGWGTVKKRLSAQALDQLRQQISELLASAGVCAMASEVSEGRFGVLSPGLLDLTPVIARLEQLLAKSPATRHARLQTADIPLHHHLPPSQAARALRFVLSRFSDGGIAAATAAGGPDGLESIMEHAQRRAGALQEAIGRRMFRMLFQPVVSLTDGKVHHYEALLRPNPTHGGVAANTQEFVVFAEAVGLSEELDLAVLDETLRVLQATSGTMVAVNVSGLSMQSASFRVRALEMLDVAKLRGRILIELTETAEIEDMAAAAACIADLRRSGVPICLDDFGAGAAAFRYLREFPVEYIKIDGSFVHDATRGARQRGLVATMVDLARTVGAQTVAEMIETDAQAGLMREIGVQYGQGWLFGRPGSLSGIPA